MMTDTSDTAPDTAMMMMSSCPFMAAGENMTHVTTSDRKECYIVNKPISNHPKNISKKGYRCVCLNARSIVNKKNEFNKI